MFKRIRNWFGVFGIRFLGALVPLLPYNLVILLGTGAGWLGYFLFPEKRRIALANLELAFSSKFSESFRKKIIRRSLSSFVRSLLILFWSPRLTNENLSTYVELDPESLEVLQNAARPGKGVVGLSLHFGYWELLGLVMPLIGYPMNIWVEETGVQEFDRMLSRVRSATGNRIVSRRTGIHGVFRRLKGGGFTTFLCDLNAKRGKGVWVNFFKFPVYDTYIPARLARKAQSSLVFGAALPRRGKPTRIIIREIPYSITESESTDLRRIIQTYSDYCEQIIAQYPEFWHWCYPRWKRKLNPSSKGYPYYSRYKDFREAGVFHKSRKNPENKQYLVSEIRAAELNLFAEH